MEVLQTAAAVSEVLGLPASDYYLDKDPVFEGATLEAGSTSVAALIGLMCFAAMARHWGPDILLILGPLVALILLLPLMLLALVGVFPCQLVVFLFLFSQFFPLVSSPASQ